MTIAILIAAIGLAFALGLWLWLRRRKVPGAPYAVPSRSQHSVVLVHGILGFEHFKVLGRKQHYFRGIADHLGAHGADVHAPSLAPLGSVPDRAQALVEFVESLDEERVLLIAHSMGGLDARYALCKLGLAERVRGLVTVATPHHGSRLADVASELPARAVRMFLGGVGLRTDALDWLGERSAPDFNRDVDNADGVFYGSVVGTTSRGQLLENPLLLASHELLRRLRGPNDGLVPASAQEWGEPLQTISAHHWAQIGWSTRFDARAFYLDLLLQLDARGLASTSQQ